MVRLVALLAFLLLLPAAASGQGPTEASFTIGEPKLEGRLDSDRGAMNVTLPWTYSDPGGTPAMEAGTLVWDPPTCAGDDGGLIVRGSRSQALPTFEPGSTTITGTAVFTVGATQAAPGEVPLRCTFTGEVVPSGPSATPGNRRDSVEVIVAVSYFGLIMVENVSEVILEAPPGGTMEYAFRVTSRGNARSTVTGEVLGEVPKGWVVQVPPPTDVERGGEATVVVQVTAPGGIGWINGASDFTVRVMAASAATGAAGNTVELPLAGRVRGCGADLCLLMPGLVAAAVVLLVLVVRRKVRQDAGKRKGSRSG